MAPPALQAPLPPLQHDPVTAAGTGGVGPAQGPLQSDADPVAAAAHRTAVAAGKRAADAAAASPAWSGLGMAPADAPLAAAALCGQ